jgi:hypothetical protein
MQLNLLKPYKSNVVEMNNKNKTFSLFEMGKVILCFLCCGHAALKSLHHLPNCIRGSVLSDAMSVGVINVDVVHDKIGFFPDQFGLQTMQKISRRGLT